MANSSLSRTIADSAAYSSFRAKTMHPCISSKLGNLTRSLFKQSWAVLPNETSSGISLKPVISRALAKNNTFIFTKELSFLLRVSSPSETLISPFIISPSFKQQAARDKLADATHVPCKLVNINAQHLKKLNQ